METTRHNPTASIAKIVGSRFEVKPEDIKYEKEIGRGAMAVVYLAKVKGRVCAVKTLQEEFCAGQPYKDLIMELDILTTVGSHKNLVEFYGACVHDPERPVIIEEFVDGPNLESYLAKMQLGFDLGRARIFSWTLDILRALDHLHNRNPIIMHRDLKPANMMLTKDLSTLKVADFGMSKPLLQSERMQAPHKGQTGTRRYMAPEVAASKIGYYTEKSDIFSASFVIWYMLTGVKPKIDTLKNPTLRPDTQPGMERWDDLTAIIVDMWANAPEARPSAEACISKMLSMPSIPDLSRGISSGKACCAIQ